MVVLGFDPGLERLGFGAVRRVGSQVRLVEHGLVRTPAVATPLRLEQIHREVAALLIRVKPDAVACERLFFTKNQTTGIDVAKALGVVQLAAIQAGLPCQEFSPSEVKLSIVGNGAAEKRQVGFMVQRLLGLPEPARPDDVADALAVALTYALRACSLR